MPPVNLFTRTGGSKRPKGTRLNIRTCLSVIDELAMMRVSTGRQIPFLVIGSGIGDLRWPQMGILPPISPIFPSLRIVSCLSRTKFLTV